MRNTFILISCLALAACGSEAADAETDADPSVDIGDTGGDSAGDTPAADANTDPIDVDPGDTEDTDAAPDAADAAPDTEDAAPDTRHDTVPTDVPSDTPPGDVDPECHDASHPFVQYIATPRECEVIDYDCPEGGDTFGDACGCGCVFSEPECPDPDRPGVTYVAGSPADCADIFFSCDEGEMFHTPCGCGCVVDESECPDPASPTVSYASQDPDECALIDFFCPEGWDYIADGCGCGCQLPPAVACDADRFGGTSGMAEPFSLYAACEFLIACSSSPGTDGLQAAFLAEFPEARCADGSTSGCPDGTGSFCQAFIDTVDADEVAGACALSVDSSVVMLLCGGDM